jgi:predicted HTH domain antitoxin
MASSSSSEPTDELAIAGGQYVLGESSLGKVAESAGTSRREFETVLRDAGFEALYGPRTDDPLERTLDAARNLGE